MSKDRIKLRIQKLDNQPFQYDRFNQIAFDKFQEQAPAGNYEVTYARKLPQKSEKQVKTIFGLLIQSIIDQAEENGIDTGSFIQNLISELPSGNALDRDFLYQLLLVVCPVVDDNGKRLSLSKMNTLQAAVFFDKCRNLMAAKEGIYVQEPDPNYKNNIDK